ncbi:hypothetical protein BDR04DRAFT_752462 [Suillus decipiens]|nr:hypothetical protein BDR04DRAFT_752462 [Suillus decipiens]
MTIAAGNCTALSLLDIAFHDVLCDTTRIRGCWNPDDHYFSHPQRCHKSTWSELHACVFIYVSATSLNQVSFGAANRIARLGVAPLHPLRPHFCYLSRIPTTHGLYDCPGLHRDFHIAVPSSAVMEP